MFSSAAQLFSLTGLASTAPPRVLEQRARRPAGPTGTEVQRVV